MARRCCVAATLVLLFAPWAWSDGLRPEPGVGADTAGETIQVMSTTEPPSNRNVDAMRVIAQPSQTPGRIVLQSC